MGGHRGGCGPRDGAEGPGWEAPAGCGLDRGDGKGGGGGRHFQLCCGGPGSRKGGGTGEEFGRTSSSSSSSPCLARRVRLRDPGPCHSDPALLGLSALPRSRCDVSLQVWDRQSLLVAQGTGVSECPQSLEVALCGQWPLCLGCLGVSGGQVAPEMPHPVLSAPSACPALFFQLLPWPLATPTSTPPWQCPPGEEPKLVSSPARLPFLGGTQGQGQGPQAWLLALFSFFPSCRTQGRAHSAGPAPQAPSQPPGALARASPTPAAALEGGWRPRRARPLETHYVETASLGEPQGGVWGLMDRCPGLEILGSQPHSGS